jgi:hypothetical protein
VKHKPRHHLAFATLCLEGSLFLPDQLEKAALGAARFQSEADYVNQRPNLTRCQRAILARVRGRICGVFMVAGTVPDFEDVAVVVYAEHSRFLRAKSR